jgi:hypothetical protein
MAQKRRALYLASSLVAVCSVGLTEIAIRLELIPLFMLIPISAWSVVALAAVTLGLVYLLIWKTRFRFTSRTMLLLTFLVAWPSARFANEIVHESRRANTQEASVESLLTLNPNLVSFKGRYTDGRDDYRVQRWLGLLVTRFSDPNILPHQMCYVDQVDLSSGSVGDEDIPILVGLGSIELLDLSSTAVTDTGLSCLTELTWLGELRLKGTAVSDEAVTNLKSRFPSIVVIQ